MSQLLRNLANSFCMPARLALQLCCKPQHNRMSGFQLFSVFRPGIPVLLHSNIPLHCLETINHLNSSSLSSICSFSIFSNFNYFDTNCLLVILQESGSTGMLIATLSAPRRRWKYFFSNSCFQDHHDSARLLHSVGLLVRLRT